MSFVLGAEDMSFMNNTDPDSAAELIYRRIMFHFSTCKVKVKVKGPVESNNGRGPQADAEDQL